MADIEIPPFAQSRFTHSPLIYGGGIRKGAAGAAALTTLSFRSSATSTIATITGPADIVAGDLLVLLDRAENKSGVPTSVIPSDFTSISNLNDGVNTRQILSYKIATGSEASASLTGMDGTTSDLKILAVFSGDVAIASVAIQDINEEITDGNPAGQAKNASGGSVPLIVFGCYGNNTGSLEINPRTFTGVTGTEINNGGHLYFKYAIMNSSPVDVTIDMDDEGLDNTLQSFYAECA